MKILSCLIMLVIISYTTKAGQLSLPECEVKNPLKTELHFYVNKQVLDEYSREFVGAKINSWVAYSNLTLENSCIPIVREATHIEYVTAMDSTWFQDVNAAEALLKLNLKRELPEVNERGEPIFTAIVFSNWLESHESNWCGYSSNSSFTYTIALNCPDHVMEHEIGHLSGASHDIRTLKDADENFDLEEYFRSYYPPKKSYALGFVCSQRGTVMSYEENVIPAYSNPEIEFDGVACGRAESANNSQVLREFAKKYAKE
ncbi:hypothetical protein KS665_004508 [Vibrio parahaemolyticus]|nr:hypothetical protein [Vibrio parahaemolyticus]MBE4498899.1 hypothetical protein [Vibrio parahaemolyticus]